MAVVLLMLSISSDGDQKIETRLIPNLFSLITFRQGVDQTTNPQHDAALEDLQRHRITAFFGRGPAQFVAHAGVIAPDFAKTADRLELAAGHVDAGVALGLAFLKGVAENLPRPIFVDDIDLLRVAAPDHHAVVKGLDRAGRLLRQWVFGPAERSLQRGVIFPLGHKTATGAIEARWWFTGQRRRWGGPFSRRGRDRVARAP